MNLTLHELSIGLSLQRPISKHDIQRRDDWMDRYTPDLFSLAKESLTARGLERKLEMCRDFPDDIASHAETRAVLADSESEISLNYIDYSAQEALTATGPEL